MLLLLLWGCPKKNTLETPTPPAQIAEAEASTEVAESQSTLAESPPPFEGKQQTEKLLTVGILDPIPEEISIDTPVIVQFRTLYRNGCWSQSEAVHQVNDYEISHTYTTNLATDRICTMALLPGGFQTELRFTQPGTYSGEVLVDDEKRVSYTLKVVE